MKISEAQTGVAIPTGWRDKVWTHQSGHRIPVPNFYPRSCSRLINSFTNYSCTHLSNGMEGIQFFVCTGRTFFPPKENIIFFPLLAVVRNSSAWKALALASFTIENSSSCLVEGGGLRLGEAADPLEASDLRRAWLWQWVTLPISGSNRNPLFTKPCSAQPPVQFKP